MKQEVQLWEKYCKEIAEINKPFIEAQNEQYERNNKQWKKEMVFYELKLKKYHKIEKEWEKEEEDWENLPWYKKIFTQRPFHWYWENNYPRLPYMPMYIDFPLRQPTQEGFMNWLVENKKLLK